MDTNPDDDIDDLLEELQYDNKQYVEKSLFPYLGKVFVRVNQYLY